MPHAVGSFPSAVERVYQHLVDQITHARPFRDIGDFLCQECRSCQAGGAAKDGAPRRSRVPEGKVSVAFLRDLSTHRYIPSAKPQ